MNLHEWSTSNREYGRRLLTSGFEGVRCAEDEFFREHSVTPFLNESARVALRSAALGACLGVLGSYPALRHRSAVRALAYAFLGGTIGFGAGLAWSTRDLTVSVAHGALKNMTRVRDEHWLQQHPIDYA